MKKISDKTIERIKTISPASLVAHGIIKTAPNFNSQTQRGYVCPLCGSGESGNRDSDGAGCFDSNGKFYCHACKNSAANGHKLSPIDLFAIAKGLRHESFGKIVREMCAAFGESVEEESSDTPRRTRRPNKLPPPMPKTPPAELELIRADLNVSDEPLIQFVESCGGTWRGFTADFLIRHGLKFVSNWTPPKSRVEKKFATPTPRILIPAGDDFYLARFVGNLDDYDEQTRKYVTPKLNAGSPKLFLSRRDVLDSDEPIFAVEGAIDALSVELAGYGAVALNSRTNGRLLVDALKHRQAEKKKLPPVIVLLDSDEKGREAAPTVYQMLVDIGVPCCVRFLFDETVKTDANDILVANGVDNLRDRIQTILDSSLAELDACAVELKRRKQQWLDDDSLNSLFQGGLTDLDFADRLNIFCGDSVRWVTDDKVWLVYKTNEFGGGLWHDGGEQNSTLLPYVRKMTDVLTEYAENKDERELAEKMKSTRKALSSITMLKSLDSILITADDLNKHAELICCLNGVVDLTTGKLMTADPKTFLMTQTVNAVFGEPRKENLQFVQNFFAQIMPDEMTRAGLLRWLGYCLSGETSAEKFMVWIGESGGNGKGTLGGTMLALMDGYGVGLAPRALLKSNRPADADKATTGLNGLVGRRFALSEEMPLDGEMDSSLVKNLSGGDRINLRLNFKEYRTLINQAKLNISGNFTPRIENTQDGGIRRRLLNMPFTEQFTGDRADPTLKKKLLLQDNLNALFAILVREAAEFYKHGLIISDLMTQATQKHLSDSDFVADFLVENYEFGEGLSVTVKSVIDLLKEKCPAECRPFRKRADLINLVASAKDVVLDYDYHAKQKIYKGIGKPKPKPQQGDSDSFDGEIISSDDYPPFD